jgi:hypothetical protein
VGNLRNDGVMRVLGNGVGNAPSFLYDFTWSGSSYVSFPIDVASYALAPDPTDAGCTRNDGTVRVVANTQQGKREYTWNGGTSRYDSNTVVDAVTGATAMIDAGNGRNDGVARLYAPDYAGGKMLEITSTQPMVYATPRDDLAMACIEPAADKIVLRLTNLTVHCEYRVEVTPGVGDDVLPGERAAGGGTGTDDRGDDPAVHGTDAGPAGGGSLYVGRKVEAGVAQGGG